MPYQILYECVSIQPHQTTGLIMIYSWSQDDTAVVPLEKWADNTYICSKVNSINMVTHITKYHLFAGNWNTRQGRLTAGVTAHRFHRTLCCCDFINLVTMSCVCIHLTIKTPDHSSTYLPYHYFWLTVAQTRMLTLLEYLNSFAIDA